jgi:TolB-like protein/DNA-binding winged helix-turn-helix (wHTH) protein
LRKQGLKVRLSEQPFQVLLLLLAHSGEVVTRDELRQRLWPDATFVDFEAGLNSAVRRLREALNDSAEKPRFVETLLRRGYRLIATVEPPVVPAPEKEETRGPPRPANRFRLPLWSGTTAVASVAALGAVLAVTASWERLRLRAAPEQIRSLAVLPFENLTGDPEQDYFADGMTDALTTDLAQIRALRVISRTSAMQHKSPKKSRPQIARELGVDAVVEGAVARSSGRVRVTAQLIHAATDRHLWAQSYDRELRDVLTLQREVAGAIARSIQVEVRPDEQRRLAATRAVHPEAYDAYLKGRFFWSKRSPADMLKAVGYFEQAIEKDSTYAPAGIRLARARRRPVKRDALAVRGPGGGAASDQERLEAAVILHQEQVRGVEPLWRNSQTVAVEDDPSFSVRRERGHGIRIEVRGQALRVREVPVHQVDLELELARRGVVPARREHDDRSGVAVVAAHAGVAHIRSGAAVGVGARRPVRRRGVRANAGRWVTRPRDVALIAGQAGDRVRTRAGARLAAVRPSARIAVVAGVSSGTFAPAHTPAWHASPLVHALPSSHAMGRP